MEMKSTRIHIFGASGSGTTTLGRAVANELAFPHHDTDDFYWLPTVPPFKEKRQISDRIRLMHEMFAGRADWVLSGSMDSWGQEIHRIFDHVVFVLTPTSVRIDRLREREKRHFGADAVSGGWRQRDTDEFLEWASHYDTGERGGRSHLRHEAWLAKLSCPVLRVDGAKSIEHLAAEVLNFVGR